MGRRDALWRLGKRLLGVPPREQAVARTEVAPPPAAATSGDRVATTTGDRAELADLWVVRAALEPKAKPLLVNHWATWCDGCVEELPLLVALHGRIGGRLDFVGVGWELFSSAEGPEGALRAVEAVARAHGVGWRTLVFTGEPHELFAGLELADELIPQTLLLDADGAVRFRHTGPVGSAEIAQIESILAPSAA